MSRLCAGTWVCRRRRRGWRRCSAYRSPRSSAMSWSCRSRTAEQGEELALPDLHGNGIDRAHAAIIDLADAGNLGSQRSCPEDPVDPRVDLILLRVVPLPVDLDQLGDLLRRGSAAWNHIWHRASRSCWRANTIPSRQASSARRAAACSSHRRWANSFTLLPGVMVRTCSSDSTPSLGVTNSIGWFSARHSGRCRNRG